MNTIKHQTSNNKQTSNSNSSNKKDKNAFTYKHDNRNIDSDRCEKTKYTENHQYTLILIGD